VLVNSGQANAATGVRGDRDAERATAAAADALGMDPELVLACSTGVIGEPLHMDELTAAIPQLVASLSADGGPSFAEAILTTDTRPKLAQAERGPYRVGGCAKGVAMIAPDLALATMLVFVTTDAQIPPSEIGKLASGVLEPTFESLSVDGCTSTNDTVLLFANGAAGGDLVLPDTPAWGQVEDALGEVATSLLLQLAADAEGASHVVLVEVSGAESTSDAQVVAKALADSLLVKTALFGGDPNPGRILQAVGASGVRFLPQSVDISIGEAPVVIGGEIPDAFFLPGGSLAAREEVAKPEVAISVSLGPGPGMSRALGVDLSYEYVRINAEYTT
jgi:glutamate N-acetyltransferase/amino-acid N-acetyltransferase